MPSVRRRSRVTRGGRASAIFILAPWLIALFGLRGMAQECAQLTPATRANVAAYVAARYGLAPDLRIEDRGTIGSSCFRRVDVLAAAPRETLRLFLSPDARFLSETLLDMASDPLARNASG